MGSSAKNGARACSPKPKTFLICTHKLSAFNLSPHLLAELKHLSSQSMKPKRGTAGGMCSCDHRPLRRLPELGPAQHALAVLPTTRTFHHASTPASKVALGQIISKKSSNCTGAALRRKRNSNLALRSMRSVFTSRESPRVSRDPAVAHSRMRLM